MNFFKNLSISRFVISLYGLQVSRSLKTFKTIKSGLQCTTFLSQILCLQVSVLIIHVYCFLLKGFIQVKNQEKSFSNVDCTIEKLNILRPLLKALTL